MRTRLSCAAGDFLKQIDAVIGELSHDRMRPPVAVVFTRSGRGQAHRCILVDDHDPQAGAALRQIVSAGDADDTCADHGDISFTDTHFTVSIAPARQRLREVDHISFADLHPVKHDVVRTSAFSASARCARATGERPFQSRRRDRIRATGNARAGDAPCRSPGHQSPRKAAHMTIVRLDHRKQARPIARRVERFVESPVECAPLFRIGLSCHTTGESCWLRRDRPLPSPGSPAAAHGIRARCEFEQFHDLVDRQIRDDRAAIGQERHKTLGFQLLERFPHGNTAGAEPLRQLVLPS